MRAGSPLICQRHLEPKHDGENQPEGDCPPASASNWSEKESEDEQPSCTTRARHSRQLCQLNHRALTESLGLR